MVTNGCQSDGRLTIRDTDCWMQTGTYLVVRFSVIQTTDAIQETHELTEHLQALMCQHS